MIQPWPTYNSLSPLLPPHAGRACVCSFRRCDSETITQRGQDLSSHLSSKKKTTCASCVHDVTATRHYRRYDKLHQTKHPLHMEKLLISAKKVWWAADTNDDSYVDTSEYAPLPPFPLATKSTFVETSPILLGSLSARHLLRGRYLTHNPQQHRLGRPSPCRTLKISFRMLMLISIHCTPRPVDG